MDVIRKRGLIPSSLFFFAGGICLMFALLPPDLTLCFLVSALLHELGHLALMRIAGVPIRALRPKLGGAVMVGALEAVSYPKELLIAAAGPMVNLGLMLLSSMMALWHGRALFLCNLLLFVYNLLPLDGNDGSVILMDAAELFGWGIQMRRGLHVVSGVLLAVLMMFGAWVLWYGALSDRGGGAVGYAGLFVCLVGRMWGICQRRGTDAL